MNVLEGFNQEFQKISKSFSEIQGILWINPTGFRKSFQGFKDISGGIKGDKKAI